MRYGIENLVGGMDGPIAGSGPDPSNVGKGPGIRICIGLLQIFMCGGTSITIVAAMAGLATVVLEQHFL